MVNGVFLFLVIVRHCTYVQGLLPGSAAPGSTPMCPGSCPGSAATGSTPMCPGSRPGSAVAFPPGSASPGSTYSNVSTVLTEPSS